MKFSLLKIYVYLQVWQGEVVYFVKNGGSIYSKFSTIKYTSFMFWMILEHEGENNTHVFFVVAM